MVYEEDMSSRPSIMHLLEERLYTFSVRLCWYIWHCDNGRCFSGVHR